MEISEAAEAYVRKHALIEDGDLVCVGLSGGADSVALLLALEEIRGAGRCGDFLLTAVHVNHNLRGEDAREDCAFVRELCEEHKISLRTFSCPVAEYAARHKKGLEEAGRELRQECFDRAAGEFASAFEVDASKVRIALAHHADDQAETVLFRAARGSSLTGLSGIRPKIVMRGRTFIRPFLAVTRAQIEKDLRQRGQEWRTDATNTDENYARNAIRHTVLPGLKEKVNLQSVLHLAQAAEDLAQADAYLRAQAAEAAKRCVIAGSGEEVRVSDALLEQPEILQNYVLMGVLETAAGGRKDLGREQLAALRALFCEDSGKKRNLPYGICAHRGYGEIILAKKKNRKNCYEESENVIVPRIGADRIPGESTGRFSFGHMDFFWKISDRVPESIPQNRYTKVLDYDKIKYKLVVRFRRTGDRIVVNAQGGSRKLKDYLIDEKIPQRQRDSIPLLAAGSRVFWVVGHRISEDCKVTEGTRRVLVITARKTGTE